MSSRGQGWGIYRIVIFGRDYGALETALIISGVPSDTKQFIKFFIAQKSKSAIKFPKQQAKKSPGKPRLFQTVCKIVMIKRCLMQMDVLQSLFEQQLQQQLEFQLQHF